MVEKMRTECPRCGTKLRKEKSESQPNVKVSPQQYRGGSLDPHLYQGSVDIFSTSDYVYRCPKCGYLSIDC